MVPRAFRVRRGYIHLALQVGLLALCVRLAVIQCLQHGRWLSLAEGMQRDTLMIEPQRGQILDRDGRCLAVTTRASSVFANPRAIPVQQRVAIARELAGLLECDAQEVADRLALPKYFVWIKRKVSDAQAEAVQRACMPGVGLREESCRRYPNGTFLCHLLGFVGMDGRGLEGLEARFDGVLAGKPGQEGVLRDGLGRVLAAAHSANEPAWDGQSLVLAVDARVQHIVEEELAAACDLHNPESACAIVMDPWTGDVLAMAGWPTFDPSRFGEASRRCYGNMAVADCLEPGSTFKPFIVAAALERGVVRADTLFDCHRGRYRVGSRLLRDAHPLGVLSVRDVVAYSSNIGMAQVGARLGPDRIYDALCAFGFGRETGIRLPAESAGILRHPSEWSRYTLSSITMGQEIAVSPLQLAAGFCVFANGGFYVRPRIVLAVADATGRKTVWASGRPYGRRVLSERTAKLMCDDVLVGVIERGTARRVAIEGYRMAGKTGTAQLARPDARGYEPGAYAAWFVGIVPADTPRFVIALVVKKPHGPSHYGGVVAAPAVSRIAERVLSTYRIRRKNPQVRLMSCQLETRH